MKKIFWLAGENSGDLHAAHVMEYLQKNEFYHFGIGGPKMQKAGLEQLFAFERFAVMGFWEVLKHLRFFANVKNKIESIFRADDKKPDLVVLVDYPGLNMRVAKMAKKYEIPVLYYISPQFWAWKQKRIHQLKKYTDHIAYILPLEQQYFDKYDIPSTFVGHPIAEQVEIRLTKEEFSRKFGLDINKTWLGFFPGSRVSEIEKLLPEFKEAIKQFSTKKYEFIISRAHSLPENIFSHNSQIKFISDYNYEIMQHCDFLAVKSGTSSLETAYVGTPFVIVYKTSYISYFLGKHLVKIDKIGLPNIMMQKKIVPELIQTEAEGKNIAAWIKKYLNSPTKYNELENSLQEIHQVMEKRSASQATGKIIEKMLS